MKNYEELEKKLREILNANLLDEEDLENDAPWGEDSAMYAFENGQNFGAHYLAEEILQILDSK